MKMESLLKSLNKEIDEAASLMKAYTEKLKKDGAEDEKDPEHESTESPEQEATEESSDQPSEQPENDQGEEMTPGQEDVVEAAQEGEGEQDILAYAKTLSQDELENILQVLMDEYEGRGSAGEETQPMESPDQVPEMTEKAEEVDPEMAAIADSEQPQDQAPEQMEQPIENQETMSLDEAVSQLSDEEKAKLKAALEAAMSQMAPEQPAVPPESSIEKSIKMLKQVKKSPVDAKSNGSVKAEPSKLAKSMNSILDKLEKLVPQGTPSQSYADNSNIHVLEKSSSEPSYANGFELATRLLNEQRKGNKLVKSIHVAEANGTSNEKLANMIEKLNKMGIEV
jgi:hypothetical protein